ncbi:MAG: hypothetical protein R6U21_05235 [Thermoplasmatota archaeon]
MLKNSTADNQPLSFSTPLSDVALGSVVMLEHPAEYYFAANLEMIQQLIEQGYKGVYISFQRPFANVKTLLSQSNIDIDQLTFIDAASALTGEQQTTDDHLITLDEHIAIDDLVRAVYTSLERLTGEKKFIFIDSLTTITLYKPLSETMRFSEFLVSTVKKEENITLFFNVAKDLSQKKFIKDIAFRVDQVINVGSA